MKHMFLTVARKGGSGKSEAAAQLALSLLKLGIKVKIIEVDQNRRLSIAFPELVVLSLDAGASAEDIKENTAALIRHFNPIFGVAADAPDGTAIIVDLGGGQVVDNILAWMQVSDAVDMLEEEGVGLSWLGLGIPEKSAMTSTYNTLVSTYETCGDRANYFLALNDIQGAGSAAFESYKGSELWSQIDRMVAEIGLSVMSIPFLKTDLTAWAQQFGHSIAKAKAVGDVLLGHLKSGGDIKDVEDQTLRHAIEVTGLDKKLTKGEVRMQLAQELKDISRWLDTVRESLKPVYADFVAAVAPAKTEGEEWLGEVAGEAAKAKKAKA